MPILNPPYEMTGTWGDGIWRGDHSDLWNYGFAYPEGIALVKIDGVWSTAPVIDLERAEEYYAGGTTHVIDDDKAVELTAAGFGEYITPGQESGFGQGGFGLGPFGE